MAEIAIALSVVVLMVGLGAGLAAVENMEPTNATMARFDAAAERMASTCELCSGATGYICPHCGDPIEWHSHENDYSCRVHGFVNPIRASDGRQIIGDGHPGPLRAL